MYQTKIKISKTIQKQKFKHFNMINVNFYNNYKNQK